MGGGASKIAASKYSAEESQDSSYYVGSLFNDEDEADEDDDNSETIWEEEEDEDEKKPDTWEDGLLDLDSKTFSAEQFEQSLSDSETLVGRRRTVSRRPRSLTWAHPPPPEPIRTVRRSFMCCTGNYVAFQVSLNFKPHISDLADVGGDDDDDD